MLQEEILLEKGR